ncbi:M20 metallopeptidase family protein [Flavihumibacter sp. UBA7668]|uniref:M20 metallopeptidase family protein n=1 Tax=Flavihumibacter sp. UBA7668 TaxID=1946542 RepID=UPI0025BFC699|nr:amidohydrolase [Flavihumibacter sp. UBA7668]
MQMAYKAVSILFFGLILSIPVSAQLNLSQLENSIKEKQHTYSAWYQYLHANPELSTKEIQTAAFLKKEMKALGWELVDSLGYQSFAAVLKNGNGPTILYRTDMDGLPLKELTGLPFASTNSAMHACGHDLHMSSWLGTAQIMTQLKKSWSGTLVLLAQSAEETGQGAKKVVASANYKKLPVPMAQIALHDHAELLAGQAGFCDGYSMAAVDMLNITVFGKGGHGAMPNKTIDPVVLASQYVLAMQTIVSRNLPTTENAVVTVGAIQGGTVGNIVPDQVELRLTIRSFSKEARQLIFDRIKTIGNNLALAAGLDSTRLPVYNLLDMSIPSVYNDPALGARLRANLQRQLGDSAIATVAPVMIGEDFGVYGQQAQRIPSYIMWLGTVTPERKKLALSGAMELPSLHSPRFAPDFDPSIEGAVKTMSLSLLNLLQIKD